MLVPLTDLPDGSELMVRNGDDVYWEPRQGTHQCRAFSDILLSPLTEKDRSHQTVNRLSPKYPAHLPPCRVTQPASSPYYPETSCPPIKPLSASLRPIPPSIGVPCPLTSSAGFLQENARQPQASLTKRKQEQNDKTLQAPSLNFAFPGISHKTRLHFYFSSFYPQALVTLPSLASALTTGT